MNNRIKHLKVKVKSLAAEARIIRLEENRAKGRRLSNTKRVEAIQSGVYVRNDKYYEIKGRDNDLRKSLYRHRTTSIWHEARHALLAYAFLRGRDYAAVEKKPARGTPKYLNHCYSPVNVEKVYDNVRRFGPHSLTHDPNGMRGMIRNWLAGQPSLYRREAKPAAK